MIFDALMYNFFMKKNIGLYVHIPFCEKKCDYCNFVSFCKSDDDKLKYMNALEKEIVLQGEKFSKLEYIVDTIFVGGGTPSVLQNGEIERLISNLRKHFDVDKNAEITIECNPNSLTIQKLQEFKSAGVNRLSIGLQAYNDNLLKLIGRLHTKKQFDMAIKNAKQVGFENINVDLILGIPKQKICDVKKEIKHLIKLGATHISAYGLIVEENTKLDYNLKNAVYKLPKESTSIKMYDIVLKMLKRKGIFRYEVSNFAKVGYECKHNLKYWTDKEYLGLGVVSSSYIQNKRWKNTDNFLKYCEFFEINSKGKTDLSEIIEDEEILDLNAKIEELIMLSLRTKDGIDLIDFEKQFGVDLLKKKKAEIEELSKNKFIEIKNNRLLCTDAGFKLLNQIIVMLV